MTLYSHVAELGLYKRPGGSGLVVEEALLVRQAIGVGVLFLGEKMHWGNATVSTIANTRLCIFYIQALRIDRIPSKHR